MAPAEEALPERAGELLRPPKQAEPGHVLEEQQPAVGPEQGAHAPEGSHRVGHGAEHEGGHHRVERPVGEGRVLDARLVHLDRHHGGGDPGQQAPPHGAVRLEDDDPADARGRVVRQVGAGAGPDLQHVAARLSQEVAAPVGQPCLLARRAHTVVHGGEHPVIGHWSRHITHR